MNPSTKRLVFVILGTIAVVGFVSLNWYLNGQYRKQHPVADFSMYGETISFDAQVYSISDWPGGVHYIIPENATIHVGNTTGRIYVENGTIILEGIRIK